MHDPEPSDTDRPVPDPLTTALGNASFLALGYWRLDLRGGYAAAAYATAHLFGTLILVIVLVNEARPWCEIALLVWWLAGIAHGWFFASRMPERARLRSAGLRGPRLRMLGMTAVVLVGMGFLREDADAIARDVAAARAAGDCPAVLASHDEAWLGPRMADAPRLARADAMAEACRDLRTTAARLDTALADGDLKALKEGFDRLSRSLGEPRDGKAVTAVLTAFLDGLPTGNPCNDVHVTDWLRDREPTHDVLDRSLAAAERTAPGALSGCADSAMDDKSWRQAQNRYRRLLTEFPDDTRTAHARSRLARATKAVELDTVKALFEPGNEGAYCRAPAKYRDARPISGSGINRTVFYGGENAKDDYFSKLPAGWRTTDFKKATLVACADEESGGDIVETCSYSTTDGVEKITFHRIALSVDLYELRTGKRVGTREIQIAGESCPSFVSYEYFLPGHQYVDPDTADIRAAFRPLVTGRP